MQVAIRWLLRDSRVTTVLTGASRGSQIEDSRGAINGLEFTAMNSQRSTATPSTAESISE